MLSNHNKTSSSFRIIEPKPFQQAQQIPLHISQQIPILSVNNNIHSNNITMSSNSRSNPNPSINFINQHQQANNIKQHQHQHQKLNNYNHQSHQHRSRNLSDTDSSYIPETTSESGISDLDMSEKCNCCPYGYHIDVDFVTFLQTLGGKNLNKQLKKIQRKRNEKLQKSMEYVIDEVEKIRQMNEMNLDRSDNNVTPSQFNSFDNNTVIANSQHHQRAASLIPETLKKTINKIDQQINEDTELFLNNNLSAAELAARKLMLLNKSSSFRQTSNNANNIGINNNKISTSSNNSFKLFSNSASNQQQQNHSLSVPPPQLRTTSSNTNCSNCHYELTPPIKLYQCEPPRRSYSSCGEPVILNTAANCVHNVRHLNNNVSSTTKYFNEQRRCMSNRASPIRQQQQPHQHHHHHQCNATNSFTNIAIPATTLTTALICQPCCHQQQQQQQQQPTLMPIRLSRSCNRRSASKSKSRSPQPQTTTAAEHYFKREVKINLAQPPVVKKERQISQEEHSFLLDENECKQQTVMTTTIQKTCPPPQPTPVITSTTTTKQHSLITQQSHDVQEEVLLNLFSCNNSGSVSSSESSESLVEFEDDRKLKINEVYHHQCSDQVTTKIEPKQRSNNQQQIMFEKRVFELERKLKKIPELEIKNNILLEEKQILIKQLLNMKRSSRSPPQRKQSEPPKVFRTIGCDSSSYIRRDVGTECKANTREIGVYMNMEEPKEEKIQQMQTIITHLKDRLSEQTLVMQQLQVRPVTRDVAVMHVVDKVEEIVRKPELRDVAINHRTETDDKELIEKHTIITNAYVKEIETLRCENTKLSCNLEELIKKHSKHVVTRGTHAICEPQPVLYSVGTNTKKCCTRDVQVMFTPKSRDVSLCTDRFYHTRDVGLTCSLASIEQQEMMQELIEIRRKYEELVQMSLQKIKACRDVATVCNLDHKEHRTVSLGCNIEPPVKPTRDVSLKCNLDVELRLQRDVCIGCNLDKKPVQKDACIFVDTFEPRVVEIERKVARKDFSTFVHMEDCEKIEMARELAKFKTAKIKVTRDVAISVDQRSRQSDDLTRHKACGSSEIKKISTTSRQVNTEPRATRDSSAGSSVSYEYLHSHKSCQIADDSLSSQKEQIEIERNKLIVCNNELRTRLKEIEEELIIERKRFTSHTCQQQQSVISVVNNEDVCKKQSSTNELKAVGINSIGITLRNHSAGSNSRSASNVVTSSTNESFENKNGSVKATITSVRAQSSSRSPIRSASNSSATHQSLIVKNNENSVNTTSCKQLVESLTQSNHHRQLKTTSESPVSTTDTIKISISGKLPDKGTAWSATLSPSTNITTGNCVTSVEESSSRCSQQKAVESSKCCNNSNNTLVSRSANQISKSSQSNQTTTTTTTATTSISIRARSSSASPKRGSLPPPVPQAPPPAQLPILQCASSIPVPNVSATTTTKFSNESSEKIVYKNGEIVEKKIVEKVELKKPKGILKSSTTTSASSIQANADNSKLECSTTETIHQQQRKALTFGQNEICENFQSEQSGSDFSLDGATLQNNEDEEYITTTIEYEAPVELSSSAASSSSGLTVISEESKSSRISKSTESSTHYEDEFELQEKLSKSSTSNQQVFSKSHLKEQVEEDCNEHNVFELELELHIACAILNDSLYEPLKADKNKVAKALNLIQQDWFKLAAQKDSNPHLVEDHLNAFYSRFSNLLLERIVNMADLNLNTALHYSVSTGNFEIVNLLLDTKVCDVNAQNKAGYTSIMLAAVVPMTNDYERSTLKRLFSEGNVNIKSTDSGQTALMLAVRHGNKDTVSLLLESGSDCNAQDKEGSTALMAACEHGHIDIVRLLLDNTNCDPDIKDNDGETAFDIAKNKNRNDIIVLLYAHSSKLRSHHPAIQFSKSRPRIGSASSQSGARK